MATTKVLVRMPGELKARLERAAKERGVSATAEIVRRLQASFRHEDEAGGPGMLAVRRIWHAHFCAGLVHGAEAVELPDPTNYEQALKHPVAFRVACSAADRALKDFHAAGYRASLEPAERATLESALDKVAAILVHGESK